ncbi:hypothetical protein [Methylobacterium sp. P5_C11]
MDPIASRIAVRRADVGWTMRVAGPDDAIARPERGGALRRGDARARVAV